MEPKFGKLTLDELKEVYKVCAKDPICCDRECPLYDSHKAEPCIEVLRESVLELIDSYNAVRELYEYWNEKARELSDKANKYDSVRNELIRTQELLKNSQDECRKRADKIKDMREETDSLRDELANANGMRADLHYKLCCAEANQKSLESKNKELEGVLAEKQTVINQLMKEKNEANEALLHYHALKNSLHFIGEAMRGDQSGDHEKD